MMVMYRFAAKWHGPGSFFCMDHSTVVSLQVTYTGAGSRHNRPPGNYETQETNKLKVRRQEKAANMSKKLIM